MPAVSEELLENTFLSDNFAPVHDEIKLDRFKLEGTVPDDLAGYFLRIGPNPQFMPPDTGKYHWFDGDGMIHQLHFSGASARYQNRWVRTRGFELEREAGRSIWKGFQSLHELEMHHGMMTKNVANTAMVWHQQKLLALWEAGLPHSMDIEGLSTKGEENFGGTWKGAVSAHPKVCPDTGDLIVFGYNVIGECAFSYGVYDSEGALKHRADIKLKGKPVMIHDCAITPNYTLIIDMPVTFSLDRAMQGGAAFAWEEQNGARIGLLPRYGSNDDVRWFEVETGFIFHVLNAWEEGSEVILEACRSNCSSVISDGESDKYDNDDEQARAHQYRLNLESGCASESAIADIPCEFPQVNTAYMGHRNRYAYASRFSEDSRAPRFNGLLKFDRSSNEVALHDFPDQVYSGEFVFASKSNPESEDDGYLLGFVHNEQQEQSEFYIIDARRFTEAPLARLIMPCRIPYGFHAAWVPQEKVNSC